MELNLQRTVLEGFYPVLDTVLTQEETMESIIPDALPDASRIICAAGSAYLSAKQAMTGCAKIMGTANIQILFVPEGESSPRSLTLNLPFQCTGDCPEINESNLIHGTILSVSADARLINPRKLFLKAEIKTQIKVYARSSQELTTDMASDNEGTIQKLKKEYKHHTVSAVLEKPFMFSDTLHQSSSKPSMEEIMSFSVEPATVDARYIGKKLVCKGEMALSVLYRSAAELLTARFDLPFSQILDLESNYEEGEPGIDISIKSTDCRLKEGEIEIAVEALIQATLWSQRNVTLLCDVYSTAAAVDVERAAAEICTFSERSSRKESVRKFCESGIPAKQVLSCTAFLSPLTAQRQKDQCLYNTDANVSILYLSEDNAMCCVNYTVPISCNINLNTDLTCACSCKTVGDVIAVPVTGGFEVRLEAEFSWQTSRNESAFYVAAVRPCSVSIEHEEKPSVIIRMVGQDDSLWEIAKSCGSTIQDICTANELPSELAVPGTVLLVPIKR